MKIDNSVALPRQRPSKRITILQNTAPSIWTGPLRRIACASALLLAVFLTWAPATAEIVLRLDPANVAGPKACAECHISSAKVWKETQHAKTFKALPRKKSAKEIAKRMGLRRIKAGSDCLTCHFTSNLKNNKPKPIAGVTCESCHGAGKKWIDVHSDFGGKKVTAKTEKPAHKKTRYEKSEAAGMLRPSRLYQVAANCYSCHTVPNEKLVNVGGHPVGSKFELVSWSQGEVRHNVWYTKENRNAAANRKRMMYIVGKALDLEFALRGVAKATQRERYAVAMAKRAAAARADLKKIGAAISAPEIKQIIQIGDGAKLKLNNGAPLTAAADKIAAAAKKLAANHDGANFAGVDSLIPKPANYKGKASQ